MSLNEIIMDNKIILRKGWIRYDNGEYWYHWGKSSRTKGEIVSCESCGINFPKVTSRKNKSGKHFCSKTCAAKVLTIFGGSGSSSPRWNNGKIKNKKGYILIYKPDYPGPKDSGKYVREHRLIMEAHLGRYLEPYEIIHHKNGIKDDNRLENLEIMTHKLHEGHVECPFCNNTFKIK